MRTPPQVLQTFDSSNFLMSNMRVSKISYDRPMARTGAEFDDPRLTLAGLLIEAHAGVIAELGAVHAAHGLAGTDFDALIRLARSPGRRLRMCDLAAQMALSNSGITRIVDRLERRQLVRREVPPGDRRSFQVALTSAGHDLLRADVPPLLDAIQRSLIDPLTPHQLSALTDGLRAVRDAVRPAAATVSGEARP